MSLFNFANLSDSLQAFSDANYPKSIWSSDHPINAEHRYFFFSGRTRLARSEAFLQVTVPTALSR